MRTQHGPPAKYTTSRSPLGSSRQIAHPKDRNEKTADPPMRLNEKIGHLRNSLSRIKTIYVVRRVLAGSGGVGRRQIGIGSNPDSGKTAPRADKQCGGCQTHECQQQRVLDQVLTVLILDVAEQGVTLLSHDLK